MDTNGGVIKEICKFAGLATTALVVLLMAGSAFGQGVSSGTILGVVKDTSGGSVAGANVTVTNVDTAETRSTTTGDDGAYRFPGMRPGHYSLKIEKDGFKTAIQTGLNLDVTQELVTNPVLEIGSSAQEVTVSGEAPIINTTTSSLGGLVNDAQMAELPLNGREYIDLTMLQPGLTRQFSPGAASTGPRGGGISGLWFSANGAGIVSNNYLLDGQELANLYWTSSASLNGDTLGVDGIKEYKVATSSYDATYGMVMGGQILMVSKSGTNQFHGAAFEYIRNSALDARNFFDSAASAGKTASGAQRRLPPFKRNNFGASFGGPIRKDKTFFYGVYEGLRQITGLTFVDVVPSASCHNLVAVGANFEFPNDATAANCASGLKGMTNASPTIVLARIRPFLDLYPTPTCGTASCTGYVTSGAQPVSENFGQIRADHVLSPSDSLFARYNLDYASIVIPSAFPELFSAHGNNWNHFGNLSETHIFSPVLLNTSRLSYSRTRFALSNIYLIDVTTPALSMVGNGTPIGTFNPGSGLTAMGSGSGYPDNHIQNIIALADDVYYTRGRHALKFGLLINRFDDTTFHFQYGQGQMIFSNLTNFLGGIYNAYNSVIPGGFFFDNRNYRYWTYGFYGQDDVKLAPRLTLNLGLRWEFQTTVNERQGRQSRFLNFNCNCASNDYTLGQAVGNPGYKNFSPRVGFAWDVFGNGKTAVRSGAGLYYDVGNIGSALNLIAQSEPPFTPYQTVANPFNTTNVIPIPFDYTGVGAGLSIQTVDYYLHTPYSLQYNLSISQQLPFGIGLTVAYAGFQGRHLWKVSEANPFFPSLNPTGPAGAVQWDPWLCSGALSTTPCAGTPALLPNNPGYVRLNQRYQMAIMMNTGGSSTYNGLQVVATKRLTKALEFQGAFTWGHSTDGTVQQSFNTEGCAGNGLPVDMFNQQVDRGATCYMKKYSMNTSVLYNLPNIKLGNVFVSKALQGWRLGSIISVQSGSYFTPSIGNIDRAESGLFSNNRGNVDRLDLGAATTTVTLPVSGGTNTYTFIPYNASTVITGDPNNWYNPLMFKLEPTGTIGNTARSLLLGPGLATVNFSVAKDTSVPFLGEQGVIEFRAEFFNLFNRANFALPGSQGYNGTLTDAGPYSESPVGASTTNPLGTAGKILATNTTSRQIQFALKVIF